MKVDIKELILKNLRSYQNRDEPYIIERNARGGTVYTRNDIIREIENDTAYGLRLVENCAHACVDHWMHEQDYMNRG